MASLTAYAKKRAALCGRERYVLWLHDLHRRKELESMIEGLRKEGGL